MSTFYLANIFQFLSKYLRIQIRPLPLGGGEVKIYVGGAYANEPWKDCFLQARKQTDEFLEL